MDLIALDQVKARLEAEAPSLRQVGFAADFNAATQPGAVIAGPAAFVITTGEEWAPPKAASAPMTQWVAITISILIAVKLAGARGEAGLAALATPIGEVRAALFGWHHPDADGPMAMSGGGVEDFDGKTQVLVYRLDYNALTSIQETL